MFTKMKTNRIFKKTIIDKNFSKMCPELKTILFSTLSTAAEQNDYLENLTDHSDAIGWHLGKVDVLDFLDQLKEFFTLHLRTLRKQSSMNFLTLAFDETFLAYYGKAESPWIHGYKNKVKGATGSYKFMVVSIVVRNEKYVLYALPMSQGDNSVKLFSDLLLEIKKFFRVSLVLLDRGFASKELAYNMAKQKQEYIALCPRWKNVERFLKEGIKEVTETKTIRHHRRENTVEMGYVLEYDLFEHDWIFLTNTGLRGVDLVRAYKARWGIETTFRVMDHADIKSKSTNIVIRSFFFLISIVLYNYWIEEREKEGLTFTQFLDMNALAHKPIQQLLKEARLAKERMGIPLTAEDKQQLSCIA